MERIVKTALQNRVPTPPIAPVLNPEGGATLPSVESSVEMPIPESPLEEALPPPIELPEPIVESPAPEEPSMNEPLSEETPTQVAPTQEIHVEETPQELTSQENHVQEFPVKIDLKNRDDAYRQLELIATFLEHSDPHSLAPQLIRQLIRWEHKNVMDIFAEIAKTPEEYAILMKILGSSSLEN
jgi:predicted component of type VI protein secretion system